MHESNPPSLLLNTTVLSTAGTAIVGAKTPRKVTMRAVTERISKFRTDCHCGCIDVQYTLGVPSNYGSRLYRSPFRQIRITVAHYFILPSISQ